MARKKIGDSVARRKLYGIWYMMIHRCHNVGSRAYSSYGGRGLEVCSRWRFGDGTLSGLDCFVLDIGPRPSSDHQLERIDNSLGYSPDNCCWATRLDQANNKRNNRTIEFMGETLSLAEWSRRTGIDQTTIRVRLDLGWSPDLTLTAAVGSQPKKGSKSVELAGESMTLYEVSQRFGLSYSLVKIRHRRGWPLDRIISVPPRPLRKRAAP